ncbi:MAG TPA: AAA domain-containing protein, partial [Mycobacteriales bacterium]|nr:AAA domain-containing protein [Mycobacteriales bacterium]
MTGGASVDDDLVHAEVRAALVQMQAALEVEVVELRSAGAQQGRECHGGVRLTSGAKRATYAFGDVPGARLTDDLPVKLVLPYDAGEVEGDVVSHRDGELVVGIARDVGAVIDHAVLVTDASFLLERLAARLGEVLEDEVEVDLLSMARALGLAPVHAGTAPVPDDVAAALNEEQCAAVALGLGSDLTYVWGPPGTGKTTTVAHLVAAHYRAGRSVLLVSNTNTAVDTAVLRVAELLAEEPGFAAGSVLRHRAVVLDELRERYGDHLAADEVLVRLRAPLLTERGRLAAELSDLGEDGSAADRRALRERLEQLDRKLDVDEPALLDRAGVVAATVYQTWLGGLPDRAYDVVVVDEAS